MAEIPEREVFRAVKPQRLEALIGNEEERPFRNGDELFDEVLANLQQEMDTVQHAA